MGSAGVVRQSPMIARSASSASSWLFQSLLGFAFCVSFFVLVEPAPVDGLLLALFAFGLLFGIVRLRQMPVLPIALLTGLAVANLVSMSGADDRVRAMSYTFVTFYMMTSWALFVGALNSYGASALKAIFSGYSLAVLFAVIPAVASYFHLIGFQSILLLYGRPKGLFKDPN